MTVDDLILFIHIIRKLDNNQLNKFSKIIEKQKTNNNLSAFLILSSFFRDNFDLLLMLFENKKSEKILENINSLSVILVSLKEKSEEKILKTIVFSKIEQLIDGAFL
jgi:hypothetical protein